MRGWIVLLCLALNMSAIAHAEDSTATRHQQMSELLFPESKTWKSIEVFPEINKHYFSDNKWAFRSSFLKQIDDKMEDPDCSFITRVLYERDDKDVFRIGDVNGDGSKDIIYAGSAQCREGDVTVFWLAEKDKMLSYNLMSYPFLVLKVEEGKKRRISSVKIGCCGDPMSEYYLGEFKNARGYARHRVNSRLDLPKDITVITERYKAEKELTIRSSLKIYDKYDADASQFMFKAVFGNIEAKYMPGVEGTILAKYKDSSGIYWGLIAMDEKSRPYLTHSPDDATVGWVILK